MGYTDAPAGWWRDFVLAEPPRTAKLAVVRADGSPHVAPVWVDLDGDQIVFMTSAETIKGKAILRDPRVSCAGTMNCRPSASSLWPARPQPQRILLNCCAGRLVSAAVTWALTGQWSTAAGTGSRQSSWCESR